MSVLLLTLPFGLTLAETVTEIFADIPETHANADAVVYVYQTGIVNGYPDGTFGADKTINRAEFTKIFVNANYDREVIEACDSTSLPFADVSPNDWFAPFVCVGFRQGIIKGYDDGNFKPGNTINFVESAKILTIGAIGESVSSPWYKDYVLALESKKSIPTDIVDFGQNLTRGQMAEMIMRLNANIDTKPSTSYGQIETGEAPGLEIDVSVSAEANLEAENAVDELLEYELEQAEQEIEGIESEVDQAEEAIAALSNELEDLSGVPGVPEVPATPEVPEATPTETPQQATPTSSPTAEPTATQAPEPSPTDRPTPAVYLDYTQESFAQAQANGNPFVLFVTASWCPACQALNSQILAGIEGLADNGIILRVDYDTMSDEMKQEYGVTDKHTGIMIDADGETSTTIQTVNYEQIQAHLAGN